MRPDAAGEALPPTELADEATGALDRLAHGDAFDLFSAADREVAEAVDRAKASIVRAVQWAVESLSKGGRLIYVGAGTSGRLGVLDASECPPTFQSDPARVLGVLAGGEAALVRAVEGAEDSAEAGGSAMRAREVGPNDLVVGISASGRTPFVAGALEVARGLGARTALQTSVPESACTIAADLVIATTTGPEVLAGSTRLKAGTATKLVLNRLSTLTMVALGKVYRNRMVDLDTRANVKLRRRGERMLIELCDLGEEEASTLLDLAEGRVKTAICMHRRGLDRGAAERALEEAGGSLARALGETV